MRLFFSLFLGASVLALAFWAYQENYRTREALADQRRVQTEIGQLREQLSVLRAEWAYLNRPERLRELAALNFDRLRLMPMSPEHFGRLDQVDYLPKEIPPQVLEFLVDPSIVIPASQPLDALTGAAQ